MKVSRKSGCGFNLVGFGHLEGLRRMLTHESPSSDSDCPRLPSVNWLKKGERGGNLEFALMTDNSQAFKVRAVLEKMQLIARDIETE